MKLDGADRFACHTIGFIEKGAGELVLLGVVEGEKAQCAGIWGGGAGSGGE